MNWGIQQNFEDRSAPPPILLSTRLCVKNVVGYWDGMYAPEQLISERIGGQLYSRRQHPPEYRRVVARVIAGLDLYHRVDQWELLFSERVKLRRDSLVPDVVGWDTQHVKPFKGRPSWVCEVVSPEQPDPIKLKVDSYSAGGVRYLWVLNPALRRLTYIDLQKGKEIHYERTKGIEFLAPFHLAPVNYFHLWGRGIRFSNR